MRRKLAAGNWKMNGGTAELDSLRELGRTRGGAAVDILICPPFTLITAAVAQSGAIAIGAQDCHADEAGAHTGDTSARMLADVGASAVILGHSERRANHGETSEGVQGKARAAHAAGLIAIVCVGESLAQREAQNTLDIIGEQLATSIPDTATGENTVIAYEPCWAIGTGLTPTTDQIGDVHDFIRTQLESRLGTNAGGSIRLLYGGSVKAGNAAEIFAVSNVDGALVGGASLMADDFLPIISALEDEC
jgi:triosephosphate isomerase